MAFVGSMKQMGFRSIPDQNTPLGSSKTKSNFAKESWKMFKFERRLIEEYSRKLIWNALPSESKGNYSSATIVFHFV